MGFYDDVFVTSKHILDFKQQGLKWPKKMVICRSKDRNLCGNTLDTTKYSCRSLIVRFSKQWFLDLADQMETDAAYTLDDNQAKLVQMAIVTSLLKVTSDFKPTIKFLIVEDSSVFSGLLAYVGQINNWVMIQLNPIGHKSLATMEEEERCQCFGRRVKYYLGFYHVHSRPIAHYSPDKLIDADEL